MGWLLTLGGTWYPCLIAGLWGLGIRGEASPYAHCRTFHGGPAALPRWCPAPAFQKPSLETHRALLHSGQAAFAIRQRRIAGRGPKPISISSPPLGQEWMSLSGQVRSIYKSLTLWRFYRKCSFRFARQPLGFLTFHRDSSLFVTGQSVSVITAQTD